MLCAAGAQRKISNSINAEINARDRPKGGDNPHRFWWGCHCTENHLKDEEVIGCSERFRPDKMCC